MDALARLTAESEIRNLVARLGHLADDGDIDFYLTMWTEDGSWGRGDGTMQSGHEALRARIIADRAANVQGPGTDSRHVNTTLWIEVDSEDEAHSESYFLYLRDANTDNPVVRKTGRYRDRFKRTPDGWKFFQRQIVLDVN